MNLATPTSFQRARVQSYQEEEELEQVRSSAPTSELKLMCDWNAVLQMDDSEGTVRQIGAFSEGINNLTVSSCRWQLGRHSLDLHAGCVFQSMLKDEDFLQELPVTESRVV